MHLLINYACKKPAEILGMESLKGSIEIGKQADLVVFDPSNSFVMDSDADT